MGAIGACDLTMRSRRRCIRRRAALLLAWRRIFPTSRARREEIERREFALSRGAQRGEVLVMVALRLFLPESWTSDLSRLKRAGVPVEYRAARTKPEIALAEIDRMISAGLRFGCVLA